MPISSTESEWIIEKDVYPAIISREAFQKANTTRNLTKRQNQHLYESRYLLSGLVKCVRCGFNYQGQSCRKYNIYYYVDGGYMNKGESVCGRLVIRKGKLESFVLDHIRQSLPTSKVASRFEEMISNYLEHRRDGNGELEEVQKRLSDTDQKIQNLLQLVEKGVDLDTVLSRLQSLEKEKKVLECQRVE